MSLHFISATVELRCDNIDCHQLVRLANTGCEITPEQVEAAQEAHNRHHVPSDLEDMHTLERPMTVNGIGVMRWEDW